MKQRITKRSCLLAGVLTMAAATGCGPSQPASTPPAAEVRGEAISTPVAKAEETQPAATDGTNTMAFTSPAATPDKATLAEATAAKPAEATPVSTPVTKPATELPKTEDGFLQVGFDKLASFNYEVPDGPVQTKEGAGGAALKADQIPKEVKALDRQRVALQGFMLPLKVENGLITELLVMRDQSMCCFGTVPKINEWVSVKMTGKGVKPIMDQAVTLYGRLKVGEILENGYLVGIYEMDGERMSGPLEL
jgi:hypothetical protein